MCILVGRLIGIENVKRIIAFFYYLNLMNSLNMMYSVWISNYNLLYQLGFFEIVIDGLSSIMVLLVIVVSFVVHMYSLSYMSGDANIIRFISYLSLFTFFMIFLVTSNNLIQVFFGWEGVGICSYFLVGFWNTRILAVKSSMKAILVNKVGDIFFIVVIAISLLLYGQCTFTTMEVYVSQGCLIIGIFSIIAATSKSSQFGLHTWLPDAMEGPTPVSALIHAATMVTAGVFFILRLSILLEKSSMSLAILFILGAITSFFSASIANTQNDLKKVIAYSTCSQLGYMIMITGLSQYSISIFHLFNHGFFKALLFLSAGIVIHNTLDEQDFRKGGSLVNISKSTYVLMLNSSLVLAGLPFLSGFYSKDLILEIASVNCLTLVGIYLATVATFFTSFYSFRLLTKSFIVRVNNSYLATRLSTESSFNIYTYITSLFILAILAGYLFKGVILMESIPSINKILKHYPFMFSLIGSYIAIRLSTKNSSIMIFFKIMSVIILMLFLKNNYLNLIWFLIGFFVIIYTFDKENNVSLISDYLGLLWCFNEVINIFTILIYNVSNTIFIRYDQQILEWIGPRWFSYQTNTINGILFYNRGIISNYILIVILFLLII